MPLALTVSSTSPSVRCGDDEIEKQRVRRAPPSGTVTATCWPGAWPGQPGRGRSASVTVPGVVWATATMRAGGRAVAHLAPAVTR